MKKSIIFLAIAMAHLNAAQASETINNQTNPDHQIHYVFSDGSGNLIRKNSCNATTFHQDYGQFFVDENGRNLKLESGDVDRSHVPKYSKEITSKIGIVPIKEQTIASGEIITCKGAKFKDAAGQEFIAEKDLTFPYKKPVGKEKILWGKIIGGSLAATSILYGLVRTGPLGLARFMASPKFIDGFYARTGALARTVAQRSTNLWK
jgi:hypothetical protein